MPCHRSRPCPRETRRPANPARPATDHAPARGRPEDRPILHTLLSITTLPAEDPETGQSCTPCYRPRPCLRETRRPANPARTAIDHNPARARPGRGAGSARKLCPGGYIPQVLPACFPVYFCLPCVEHRSKTTGFDALPCSRPLKEYRYVCPPRSQSTPHPAGAGHVVGARWDARLQPGRSNAAGASCPCPLKPYATRSAAGTYSFKTSQLTGKGKGGGAAWRLLLNKGKNGKGAVPPSTAGGFPFHSLKAGEKIKLSAR